MNKWIEARDDQRTHRRLVLEQGMEFRENFLLVWELQALGKSDKRETKRQYWRPGIHCSPIPDQGPCLSLLITD